MSRFFALIALGMLFGCAHTVGIKQPPVQVVDTACVWAHPILISRNDKLTPGTARQILNFDLIVTKNCHVKR